jgi:hypothetical protein
MSRHMQGLTPIRKSGQRGSRRKRMGSQRDMSNQSTRRSGYGTGRSSSMGRTGRSIMSSPMASGRGSQHSRRSDIFSGPGNTRPPEKGGHGGYSFDTRPSGDDTQYRPKGWRDESVPRLGKALPGRKLEPEGSRGSRRRR